MVIDILLKRFRMWIGISSCFVKKFQLDEIYQEKSILIFQIIVMYAI